MTFQPPAQEQAPRLSFSYSSMMTVVQTKQEDLPIACFFSLGYLIYPNKIDGYFIWDVPGAQKCDPECPCIYDDESDDEYEFNRRSRDERKKVTILRYLVTQSLLYL